MKKNDLDKNPMCKTMETWTNNIQAVHDEMVNKKHNETHRTQIDEFLYQKT